MGDIVKTFKFDEWLLQGLSLASLFLISKEILKFIKKTHNLIAICSYCKTTTFCGNGKRKIKVDKFWKSEMRREIIFYWRLVTLLGGKKTFEIDYLEAFLKEMECNQHLLFVTYELTTLTRKGIFLHSNT